MTGDAWLVRAKERHGGDPKLYWVIRRRIQRRCQRMSPDAARSLLLDFAAEGSRPTLIAWVGGWSQSLDGVVRRALGVRAARGGRYDDAG